MTKQEWLTHFCNDVAPKDEWVLLGGHLLRRARDLLCPLSAEFGINSQGFHADGAKSGLNANDIIEIITTADCYTDDLPPTLSVMREAMLLACKLTESADDTCRT